MIQIQIPVENGEYLRLGLVKEFCSRIVNLFRDILFSYFPSKSITTVLLLHIHSGYVDCLNINIEELRAIVFAACTSTMELFALKITN